MNTTKAVAERYSKAAQKYESMPCCPGNSYDKRYLKAIPSEVIERDYGCGDPSKYLRPGDAVLDLGSGGGKMCFVAAQMVGPKGRVIDVSEAQPFACVAGSTLRPPAVTKTGQAAQAESTERAKGCC